MSILSKSTVALFMMIPLKIKSLLFFLIISISQFGFGQDKTEQLVLEHVNHLRDSLGLKKLRLDQTLRKAADDHSFYMARKNDLSHFQGTFTKETPAERVKYYKGNRTYTGENIATTSLKKIGKSIDYQYIAKRLFDSWFNSPKHYANMINPHFTKMGLSTSISKSNVVFSAQVFSSNEIQLPPYFRNSDMAWGVRPSEITCKDDEQRYETMFFANSVEIQGNDVYMYFHDREFFEHVIQHDNDGLAIDIVLRQQLPCNKENQFHISEVHDGEMQQPIYASDIYRNNVSKNPKKIKVKIGEVPPYLRNKRWQANVIIINKNKLCDYSYPVEVPSAIYPLLKINPYYENSKENKRAFPLVRIKDAIHVKLNYERSKGRFFALNNDEFGRMLSWNKYVKNVQVDCFTSVKGPYWFNVQLLDKRTESVSSLLANNYFDLNKVTFKAEENWDLMNRQISENSIDELKNKSKEQIKYYLKKNQSHLLDSLLFDQRTTHIRATVDTTLRIASYNALMLGSQYDSTLVFNDLPWNRILIDDYILPRNLIERSIIDSLKSKKGLKTNLLAAATIKNSFFAMDSIMVEEFLEEIDKSNSKQVFNYAHFLTNYWFSKFAHSYETEDVAITTTPNDLRSMVFKLDSGIIDDISMARLQINTLLAGIHYYVAHNAWKPVNDYFDLISKMVKTENFNAQEAMELALFCNHFHKFEIAVQILDPFYENRSLSEDGYFVLAQTATIIREKLEDEKYWAYMEMAKKANHSRYCKWLDSSFQIQRDEHIKRDFCVECR